MDSPCPRCQHQNPPARLVCLACGEPLKRQTPLPLSVNLKPIEESVSSAATWTYISIIIVLSIAGIVYRALVLHHLEQSAALFIGLPALMGVLLALAPRPKSLTGMIMRMMTLGLLLSGPVLGEGFICVLFAAPLFLGIGLIIGLIADYLQKKEDRRESQKGGRLHMLIPLPLLFMSLEGTTSWLSFPRDESVTVTETVPLSSVAVEDALAKPPRFNIRPTGILVIGFPVPVGSDGQGLHLGTKRIIHFSGGEGRPPGDLTSEVTEVGEGFARFSILSDTSHITHWLKWKDSEVRWRAVDAVSTSVTWTIHFERRLDPAWYFGWPERAVIRECAKYMIKTCAI